MKCDICNSKATVFLTQLVNGKMTKVRLCEKCAEQKGVTDPAGFSLADFLASQPAAPGASPASQPARDPSRTCPNCGFTLDDLQRVRRFGCSECYTFFADEVEPMLQGMHKGHQHIGKIPEGLIAHQLYRQRLDDLRTKLDEAIKSESYESAAALRDEIRTLSEHQGKPDTSSR